MTSDLACSWCGYITIFGPLSFPVASRGRCTHLINPSSCLTLGMDFETKVPPPAVICTWYLNGLVVYIHYLYFVFERPGCLRTLFVLCTWTASLSPHIICTLYLKGLVVSTHYLYFVLERPGCLNTLFSSVSLRPTCCTKTVIQKVIS